MHAMSGLDTPIAITQEEESELEQVEQEISKGKSDKGINSKEADKEKEKSKGGLLMRMLSMVFSQIFIKCFTLTFLAEWGDRSQIATIGCV